MYYILTSKKKERILATKSYVEASEFIVKNKDAKIRTLDHIAKPKIMDKRLFLKNFYESTKDTNKLFELIGVMIPNVNHVYPLVNLLGLKEEYKTYKNNINKIP